MVSCPPHSETQSISWPQQQEQKWQTLATNKMNQLDSLFQDHLRWFRQHKTTTSLVGTRRTLTNDDTTENEQPKRIRIRFDAKNQNQSNLDTNTTSETDHVPTHTITTTNPDDNHSDTLAQDDHPSAAHEATHDVSSPDDVNQGSIQSPQTPTKISREYLLRHFEQEEQKYGRYGLRNRSLGSSRAATTSPKQNASPTEQHQQRRKTLGYINSNTRPLVSISSGEDTTMEAAADSEDIAPPVSLSDTRHPTPSLPSKQPNTPTIKEQRHRTYGKEEQFDDEVLLVSCSRNNSKSLSPSAAALNDGASQLDQHSGLGGANNSLLAGEGHSFSSIFSFNRASSTLEVPTHLDDVNASRINSNSIANRAYTPKRPTDSYHGRPSRLTTHSFPSTPSKSKTPATAPSSLVPATSPHRHTVSQPRHQSYTPGKPWNATPVSTSFLSSSSIYSIASPKRESSRHSSNIDSSNQKKSSKENNDMTQTQKVTEELHKVDEQQQQHIETTTDDESQPTEFLIPSWALHPELDHLLQEQVKMDADKIFGKMPPIQMSQIVKMSGH